MTKRVSSNESNVNIVYAEQCRRDGAEAMRDAAEKQANDVSIAQGSQSEGENEPDFSRHLHGEQVAQAIAKLIGFLPLPGEE